MPAAPASGLTRTIYNTFFKKNSVFVTSIFAGAIAFEVAFDSTSTKVWDHLNKGVSTSFLVKDQVDADMLHLLETMEGYSRQVRFRINYLIAQQTQPPSLYTKTICSRRITVYFGSNYPLSNVQIKFIYYKSILYLISFKRFSMFWVMER